MTKRKRADSPDAAVSAMMAPMVVPPDTMPLTDAEMPFFSSVIAELPRVEWTTHKTELAAMLARAMRMHRDEMDMLNDEGVSIVTEKGHPAQNPRLGALRMLETSIDRIRKTLGMDARAQGRIEDTQKRRDILKSHEGEAIDDDLLARPN